MSLHSAKVLDGFSELQKDDLYPTARLGGCFDKLWWISLVPLAFIFTFSVLLNNLPNLLDDWVFIVFSVLLALEWWLFRNMLESVPRDLNFLAASGRLKRRHPSEYKAFDEELRDMIRLSPFPEQAQRRWRPKIGFWQIASAGAIGLMIVYTILFNDYYHWLGELLTGLNGKCAPQQFLFGVVEVLHPWPIFDVAHCATQNFISGVVGGPVPLFWALPIGAGIWIVVAIGLSLSKLTKMFEFDPIPGHPDGSGGLRKLGDICFRMGLLSVLPQLVTLGIFVYGQKIATNSIVVTMAGIVSVIFLILAIPCFIRPMWHIHQEMRVRRDEYEMKLAQKIIQAEGELREYFKPASPNAPDLEAIQKKIDTLQKLSSKAREFPTWPFSRRITLVISSNIIVPLATFFLPALFPQFKDLITLVLNASK